MCIALHCDNEVSLQPEGVHLAIVIKPSTSLLPTDREYHTRALAHSHGLKYLLYQGLDWPG